MVCLPLIAEQNAHEICLTQECLQIVRRLLWKQTTTHSIRNNNPMFGQQPLPRFNCTSQYFVESYEISLPGEVILHDRLSALSCHFPRLPRTNSLCGGHWHGNGHFIMWSTNQGPGIEGGGGGAFLGWQGWRVSRGA